MRRAVTGAPRRAPVARRPAAAAPTTAGRGGGASAGTGGATAGRGGANDAGRGGGAAGGAGGTAGGGGSGAGGATAGRGGGGASGSGGAADPGSDGDGDFTIGPTYTKQTDLMSRGASPGKSFNFTMSSPDSAIFTGLDTTLNAPKAFTRRVDVYVPAKYKDGTPAPFVVIQDGPGQLGSIRNALDNLTQDSTPSDRRLPAFVAIAVANGGGDSLGSERGLEYDTMSDRYARFIDTEVLPTVRANAQIKAAYPNLSFTTDPDGRAAIGCSSGGAAAMTMGWFKPDLFHRLITYSGTFVDQQDTDAPEEKMFPLGAWEYHTGLSLIANSDPKPLRVFVNANEMDNGYNQPESGHHNWLLANQRMAAAFKAKGYHYRYVFGMGAGHCDGKVQDATLADTLVWAWRGYPINW